MTLTSELGLDSVKVSQKAKYLTQRSFSSEVTVETQTHTDTSARLLFPYH